MAHIIDVTPWRTRSRDFLAVRSWRSGVSLCWNTCSGERGPADVLTAAITYSSLVGTIQSKVARRLADLASAKPTAVIINGSARVFLRPTDYR